MYKISKLRNGIRVVCENIDYVRSASIGVWIGAGSAMETLENNGVSHYIEHMLFKGTKTRSARQIAEFMDSVGGQLNAVTSKEYTCFYAKTLTQHLGMAVEILSDMLINSTFLEENIETERRVIAEEISMGEDDPEDFVHDCLSKILWSGASLGFPIGGSQDSLAKISRHTMLDYMDTFYKSENIVISVVGNFDEDSLFTMLESSFGKIKSGFSNPYTQDKIEISKNIKVVTKDIEQCQLCMGLGGFARDDQRRHSLYIMNAIFGGNMSSRLFQKVREEMGLAYSIYSYANTYQKNGSVVICAGLNNQKLTDALSAIGDEIKILKRDKLSKETVAVAKEQMKASVIMGLESMSARMSSYGKSVLYGQPLETLEDTIKTIDSVTHDTVADVIDTVFDRDRLNIAVCGKQTETKKEIENAIEF